VPYSVLMYSYYFPPQYSGAAKQAISLARVLRSRGHRVEFVTVRWPGLAATDEVDGFRVWRLKEGRGRRHTELLLWWNLCRFLLVHRYRFHVLHGHGASYRNAVLGPFARLLRAKSVIKGTLAQNDLAGVGRGVVGSLHKWMLRQASACVAISRDLAAEFREAGVPGERIWQIPNGVDTGRFRPAETEKERQALRAELGLPADRPVVLAVGVFDRRKNLGWLMEEWVRHRAFGTGGVLVTIGPRAREDVNGVFVGGLDALAGRNPELLDRRDPVSDIERYYRAADVFVLPSHGEGLPNVVLEAMASGVPCVASMVSGTADLVEDGVTGWGFAPNDTEGLARALGKALGPEGRIAARAAWRKVNAEYAIERVADRYEELYAAVVNGGSNGSMAPARAGDEAAVGGGGNPEIGRSGEGATT